MRAEPAFRSSFLFVSTSSILGSGCLLNANAYDTGGGTSTSTSTSTSSTTGGTWGHHHEHRRQRHGRHDRRDGWNEHHVERRHRRSRRRDGRHRGIRAADVLPEGARRGNHAVGRGDDRSGHRVAARAGGGGVLRSEEHGRGWALVYTSVGDMAGGTATMFWNIPYDKRLEIVDPNGAPSLEKNYYAGRLYKYGTEYRMHIVDTLNVEAIGSCTGRRRAFIKTTMHFMSPAKQPTNLSDDVYYSQFAGLGGRGLRLRQRHEPGLLFEVGQRDSALRRVLVLQPRGRIRPSPATRPITRTPAWGPHISNATLAKIKHGARDGRQASAHWRAIRTRGALDAAQAHLAVRPLVTRREDKACAESQGLSGRAGQGARIFARWSRRSRTGAGRRGSSRSRTWRSGPATGGHRFVGERL